MMGSGERSVPICFTTSATRIAAVETLNGIAAPIVPMGTISAARSGARIRGFDGLLW